MAWNWQFGQNNARPLSEGPVLTQNAPGDGDSPEYNNSAGDHILTGWHDHPYELNRDNKGRKPDKGASKSSRFFKPTRKGPAAIDKGDGEDARGKSGGAFGRWSFFGYGNSGKSVSSRSEPDHPGTFDTGTLSRKIHDAIPLDMRYGNKWSGVQQGLGYMAISGPGRAKGNKDWVSNSTRADSGDSYSSSSHDDSMGRDIYGIAGSKTANGNCNYGRDLCVFCFETLCSKLNDSPLPDLPQPYDKNFRVGGFFVTWNTGSEKSGYNLRGCIGYLEDIDLGQLGSYAIKAGLYDSRFDPIGWNELKLLTCRVSVLHTYEDARNCYDWERGKHGMIIDFDDPQNKSRHFHATYLPDVAIEHNMSKEGAIRELCKKAGFYGKIDKGLQDSIKLIRYQSAVVECTAQEFVQWRNAI